MINRENLIKIGTAGGNTLNREGWNFWENKTLWMEAYIGNSLECDLQKIPAASTAA